MRGPLHEPGESLEGQPGGGGEERVEPGLRLTPFRRFHSGVWGV